MSQSSSSQSLVRGLTLFDTTALVIGTVIGTGVFIKAAVMSQTVGTPMLVLLAWIAAGILSMAGALSYAELAAMHPEAGGEYVYLKKAYGEPAAFLFGWQRFAVAGSASIASLGAGLAVFLSSFVDLSAVWIKLEGPVFGKNYSWQFGAQQVVAVSVILGMSILNCLSVAFGGKVQSLLTVLKLLGIAFVVVGVFTASKTGSWANLKQPAAVPMWCDFSLFGAAMLAALWGYDGWNNMPMTAGEVRDPERNIPRALILGMLAVTAIYCTLNLAYLYAAPDRASRDGQFEQVSRRGSRWLRPAAQSFFGDKGGKLVSLVFVLSALGAMNGSILSNARVPFAMARDGLFFKPFATIHSRTRVPIQCILIQSVWASLLALSGSFDQLTDCLLFASWIYYALTTSAVFVLRAKHPEWPRPYKTLGYPFVPALFIAVAAWLIINTLFTKPVESGVGIALMAIGFPMFALFKRTRRGAMVSVEN
ncbi:MAG: amino acid permease [Pirellulales bacterium]